jgi:hypothetical protein
VGAELDVRLLQETIQVSRQINPLIPAKLYNSQCRFAVLGQL